VDIEQEDGGIFWTTGLPRRLDKVNDRMPGASLRGAAALYLSISQNNRKRMDETIRRELYLTDALSSPPCFVPTARIWVFG